MADINTASNDNTALAQTTFRLPDDLLMQVRMVALQRRTTLKQLCIEGLELRMALLKGKEQLRKTADSILEGEMARAS